MMKNSSIRSRILAGVVVVNLLGALAVVVYLHQSYSKSIDTAATVVATQGIAAWDQIKGVDTTLDPLADPAEAARVLEGMKEITGVDYGLMVDKPLVEQDAYVAAREQLGLASNWDERGDYALLVTTENAPELLMQFSLPPSDVPEMGKGIGIENGACSKLCHDGLTGEGDYWTTRWSSDSISRAHGAFPIMGGDGQPVGIVYAVQNITTRANDAKTSMIQTLIVIGLTLLVATLFIGFLVDTLVFKRLRAMMASIESISMRVAGGDFDAQFVPDGTNDEIGKFEQFFAEFMGLISTTLKSLLK